MIENTATAAAATIAITICLWVWACKCLKSAGVHPDDAVSPSAALVASLRLFSDIIVTFNGLFLAGQSAHP